MRVENKILNKQYKINKSTEEEKTKRILENKITKDPHARAKYSYSCKFGKKNNDFYCYLLLAAENLLLAEQLQISASSSASKLPARANTNLMSSIQIRI